MLVASAGTPDMLELWDWTLAPGEEYASEPHRPGTRELLHVHSGQLTLTVDDTVTDLRAGDAASFVADVAHAYAARRPAARAPHHDGPRAHDPGATMSGAWDTAFTEAWIDTAVHDRHPDDAAVLVVAVRD